MNKKELNPSFKTVYLQEIPEIACTLSEIVHKKTGATIIHLKSDDPENLFCLSFRTTPTTSNGVAHILEHTVLCGSKKFPVKDPFFGMSRRSLNTFMNALTGDDFTCYPAASQNRQDFYNLLDVYIDACFNPNLKKLSFLQEGHRLEFSEIDNPKSELLRKGIVYNEMKGALSSPYTRLIETLNSLLFPSTTYGVNSGGDPKIIPTLTYEELLSFHQTFYHPSHCTFFFYGNFPIQDHLNFLEKNILQHTKKASPLPKLPLEKRLTKPKKVFTSYPIASYEEKKGKTFIALGWLTLPIEKQQEILALSILETVLLENDASLLKKELLKSGLCKSVSSYIDESIAEIPFVITLKGTERKDAEKIEKLILDKLKHIAKNPIDKELIESALHQHEFYRSEITGDHNPHGLNLFMRSALLKQHNVLPAKGLQIHSLFQLLRKSYKDDPYYYSTLIEKYLINNPHRVLVVMEPDQTLSKKENEEEKQSLQKLKLSLNSKEIQEIIDQSLALKAYQESEEDKNIDVLPKITLKDIEQEGKDFPLQAIQENDINIFYHNCFTNQITYAELAFALPPLEKKELTYLRLLMSFLPQIGCRERNYCDNLSFIQAHLGGLWCSLSWNPSVDDPSSFKPIFHLKGKALNHKSEKLFSLLKDMASDPNYLDLDRLQKLLHKHYTSVENSINQNALRYALTLSSSSFDNPSYIAELLYGIDYFKNLSDLIKDLNKNKLQKIAFNLLNLHKKIITNGQPDLIISCDENHFQKIKSNHFYHVYDFEKQTKKPWKCNYLPPSISSQGLLISSAVFFTAKSIKSLPYSNDDCAFLSLASCLMNNLILHPLIREQGGAYGGGASNNVSSGKFHFYSYRDPNLFKTLQAFKKSVEKIALGSFKETDIEEAKLEIIQDLDSPIAPGSRGSLAYLWLQEGKSYDKRKWFRNKILSASKQQIIHAVTEHLLPQFDQAPMISFANKTLFDRENKILKDHHIDPIPLKTISTKSSNCI